MSSPIAYVCSRFPVLREAFVIREVRALQDAGLDVRVYSLKEPHTDIGNRDFEALDNAPYYSAHLLSGQLLLDNVAALLRHPLRYLGGALQAAWRFRAHPVQAAKCLALYPKMVHYARQMRRDGVHGAVAAWASLPSLLLWVGHRLFDTPYGMTCRAWDIFVPMNQADLPAKIQSAALVRTNNQAGAKFMEQFCSSDADRKKIACVYNPFNVRALEPRAQLPNGDPLLVSGGSLVEQKGLRYLLDAIALLRDRGLRCRLRLIGEGSERPALEAQAQQLNLGDLVTFVGTLPNHEVLEEMRAAHAFVLPSVPASSGCMDGIPNVVIEAMSLGVPAISTSISGIPELVVDGESGLLVEPHDAEGLAAAIERLVRSPELQQQFATSGRARVESMFEMQGNAERLIELYRQAGIVA